MTLRKDDIGTEFLFAGYDGKAYDATLINLRRGIATIEYQVGREIVVAYIDRCDHDRLSIRLTGEDA